MKNKRDTAKSISLENNRLLNLIKTLVIIILITSVASFLYIVTSVRPKVVTKVTVPENIVFLGDSITDYYDLNKYYKNNYHTVNSGIAGNKTTDILDNMEDRVYRYNPSKVFLLIGINNMTSSNYSEKETLDDIEEIIKLIKKNRNYTEIYVESVYPINKTNNKKIDKVMIGPRSNEKVRSLNKKLKQMCEKEKVTYIDMYSKLEDKKGNLNINYTKDGIHMTDEGYKIITHELTKYMN